MKETYIYISLINTSHYSSWDDWWKRGESKKMARDNLHQHLNNTWFFFKLPFIQQLTLLHQLTSLFLHHLIPPTSLNTSYISSLEKIMTKQNKGNIFFTNDSTILNSDDNSHFFTSTSIFTSLSRASTFGARAWDYRLNALHGITRLHWGFEKPRRGSSLPRVGPLIHSTTAFIFPFKKHITENKEEKGKRMQIQCKRLD